MNKIILASCICVILIGYVSNAVTRSRMMTELDGYNSTIQEADRLTSFYRLYVPYMVIVSMDKKAEFLCGPNNTIYGIYLFGKPVYSL
jgi:hypothetical protein